MVKPLLSVILSRHCVANCRCTFECIDCTVILLPFLWPQIVNSAAFSLHWHNCRFDFHWHAATCYRAGDKLQQCKCFRGGILFLQRQKQRKDDNFSKLWITFMIKDSNNVLLELQNLLCNKLSQHCKTLGNTNHSILSFLFSLHNFLFIFTFHGNRLHNCLQGGRKDVLSLFPFVQFTAFHPLCDGRQYLCSCSEQM